MRSTCSASSRRAEARGLERRMAADAELAPRCAACGTRSAPALRHRHRAAARAARARAAAPRRRARRGRSERAPARRIVWSRFAAAAAAALALALGLDAYRVRRELGLQREVTAAARAERRALVRARRHGPSGRAFGRVSSTSTPRRARSCCGACPRPGGAGLPALGAGGDEDVPCGDFARPDGSVVAQFPVPVESYTAPIGRLFVTVEAPTPSDARRGRR